MTEFCRICLESDGDFICPCKCKGSIQHVHRNCLDTWRMSNPAVFYQCELCYYHYSFQRSMIWTIASHFYTISILTVCLLTFYSFVVGLLFHYLYPTVFQGKTVIDHSLTGLIILGGIGGIILMSMFATMIVDMLIMIGIPLERILTIQPDISKLFICIMLIYGIYNITINIYRMISDIVDVMVHDTIESIKN